jgi:diaminopimelate dehydrogenase
MTRVAVVGYGNVGQKTVEAVLESPDMDLAGIVVLPEKVEDTRNIAQGIRVVSDIEELGKVEVAILAIPSRAVPKEAPKYLNMGINTVDPYDVHGEAIVKLRRDLDKVAKENNAVAVISAGWDPGTDSIFRAVFEAMAPRGITNVNFGPGMSMGHTVVVKSIEGVRDAISITAPMGMGVHQRHVFVELEPGYDFHKVEEAIKADPYFVDDETHVKQVEDVLDLIDMGHSVHMERKGVAGRTHNQRMELIMSIANPSITGQIMVSAARASLKQRPGCYSMLEIPAVDFLFGDKEELLLRLI